MALMDASYLKKNVLDALTEGLAATAILSTDDQVEYLGKYLIEYVKRKKAANAFDSANKVIEEQLTSYNETLQKEKEAEDEVKRLLEKFEMTHTNHLGFINSCLTKSEAYDMACTHIENNLNIPSAYVAVKRVVNETETLHYLASGPNTASVSGKKLVKVVVDESEEGGPQRTGVSFECFKLPEVPEEEASEEPEEGVEKPVKEPPKAQPLVIDNVMRDKRVKFFGIPKLGAFAAVPFVYQSIDHDGGCVLVPPAEEGGAATYQLVPKECQFMIGIDTVGKYRLLTPADISKVQQVGEALIKTCEKIDKTLGANQLKYFEDSKFKAMNDIVNAVKAQIAEEEPKALAELPAPAEGENELLKPSREADAALKAWSTAIANPEFVAAVMSLKGHVLPLPQPAVTLLYALSCLLQVTPSWCKDICSDPSWDTTREVALPELTLKMIAYKSNAPRTGADNDNSVAAVKALCESGNLFDTSIYPANIPVFTVLAGWLQKAVTAREAAVAVAAEVDKVNLEAAV